MVFTEKNSLNMGMERIEWRKGNDREGQGLRCSSVVLLRLHELFRLIEDCFRREVFGGLSLHRSTAGRDAKLDDRDNPTVYQRKAQNLGKLCG